MIVESVRKTRKHEDEICSDVCNDDTMKGFCIGGWTMYIMCKLYAVYTYITSAIEVDNNTNIGSILSLLQQFDNKTNIGNIQ